MVDKGTDEVLRGFSRSTSRFSKCRKVSIAGSKSPYSDNRGDCSPQILSGEPWLYEQNISDMTTRVFVKSVII